MTVCFCGCGDRAVHLHHCVTRAEIRRWTNGTGRSFAAMTDARNLVPLAWDCHGSHHARARTLPLTMLPDSVFDFASELMGAGSASVYLARHYSGTDARLDALVAEWERAA